MRNITVTNTFCRVPIMFWVVQVVDERIDARCTFGILESKRFYKRFVVSSEGIVLRGIATQKVFVCVVRITRKFELALILQLV